MQRRFAIAGLLTAILLVPPAAAQPMTNGEVLRNFEIVAFEAEATSSHPGTIIKWTRDIRIWVRSDAEPKRHGELKALVSGHAEHLAFITGLNIEVLDRGKANLVVVFANDVFADPLGKYRDTAKTFFESEKEMEAAFARHKKHRSVCMAFLARDAARVPIGALVVIPYHADPRQILSCVAEEVTQVLGLFNDSDQIRLSMFNDRADKYRHVALTYHDVLLLRILYDPRIKHGMSRTEAMPIARQILDTLRPGARTP
jgi:hypothetical protein